METFLLGMLFGLAIGLWISVAIIEWRLSERQTNASIRFQSGAWPKQTPYRRVTDAPALPPESLSQFSPQPPTAPPPPETGQPQLTLSPTAQQLYSELLNMAQGDREKTDRLIEYERKRAPQAALETLIQNAIDRWQQDKR